MRMMNIMVTMMAAAISQRSFFSEQQLMERATPLANHRNESNRVAAASRANENLPILITEEGKVSFPTDGGAETLTRPPWWSTKHDNIDGIHD